MTEEITPPRPGETLNERYTLIEVIGRGAFGIVYRANHLDLDESVAIKVLKPDVLSRPHLIRRFEREILVAKGLRHPNTIRILDSSKTTSGLPYYVMEYLEGRGLDQVIESEYGLTEGRAKHIIEQILKGLVEAHAKGLVHRDLKPENILICDIVGEKDFVKILDFGIAKALERTRLTDSEVIVGTPTYMSPEQATGRADIDARSDIYAVGLILAECLYGEPIVLGSDIIRLLARHASHNPLEFPEVLQSSPLWPAIKRATAKAMEDRYQTATEMLDDLRTLGKLGENRIIDLTPVAGEEIIRRAVSTVPTIRSKKPVLPKRITVSEPGSPAYGGSSLRRLRWVGLAIGLAALVVVGAWMAQGNNGDPLTTPVDGSTPVEPVELAEPVEDDGQPPQEGTSQNVIDELSGIEPSDNEAFGAVQNVGVAFAVALERVAAATPTTHPIRFNGMGGVHVSINGQELGLTPFDATCPRLDHQLDLSLTRDGFQSAVQSFSLLQNQVAIQLEPIRDDEEDPEDDDDPEDEEDQEDPPEGLFGTSPIDHPNR